MVSSAHWPPVTVLVLGFGPRYSSLKPKAWVTTGTSQNDLQKVGEGQETVLWWNNRRQEWNFIVYRILYMILFEAGSH